MSYEWEAVLRDGSTVDGGSKPQSYARSLGPIRHLVVRGPGLGVRHGVEIPLGAEPAILKIHGKEAPIEEHVVRDLPVKYAFGWENSERRELWCFGGEKIELLVKDK